jgi:hypothetical protein
MAAVFTARQPRQGTDGYLANDRDAATVARMEWWLVLLVVLVAIAIVVHDDWRAYPVWWRTNKRVRAEREAKRAREQRLHELTHRED